MDINETFAENDSDSILQKAMVRGVVSIDDVVNGVYMYMYSTDLRHYIKHRDTREYINFTR